MIVTLQMIFSPVAGYITAIIVVIISAYYFKEYLPGNYLMMLRTELFRNDGMVLYKGFILSFAIWLIFVIAGKIVLKRKDIL